MQWRSAEDTEVTVSIAQPCHVILFIFYRLRKTMVIVATADVTPTHHGDNSQRIVDPILGSSKIVFAAHS